jgi:hypothetical protein
MVTRPFGVRSISVHLLLLTVAYEKGFFYGKYVDQNVGGWGCC